MTLEALQKEMVLALKEKSKFRKTIISGLIGAVKKTAIDRKCKDNITEELVNEVLLKELKSAKEMLDTCPENRPDMLIEYHHRYDIVSELAPTLVEDPDKIFEMVQQVIDGLDADARKNKGLVMRAVATKLKGKVDMKQANKIVSSLI